MSSRAGYPCRQLAIGHRVPLLHPLFPNITHDDMMLWRVKNEAIIKRLSPIGSYHLVYIHRVHQVIKLWTCEQLREQLQNYWECQIAMMVKQLTSSWRIYFAVYFNCLTIYHQSTGLEYYYGSLCLAALGYVRLLMFWCWLIMWLPHDDEVIHYL